MAYTLQQTINWAATFIQYSPQTAGFGQEPAISTASMIRSTLLSAPVAWAFNRAEDSSITTNTTDQDYTLAVTNLGYIEKVSLTDSDGNISELKDILNVAPLAKNSESGRPSAVSVLEATPYTTAKLRFNFVPDKVYKVNIVYQIAVSLLGPYLITSSGAASAGKTTYTGLFDPISFPVGSIASVTGFGTNLVPSVNDGAFTVVSATPTSLVLNNTAGVIATASAFVSNFNWSPLPDSFIYIYNNLYLSEMLAMVDDARAQQYRLRGIAGFLAKAQGLSETQKNAFVQLWLARGVEATSVGLKTQLGAQARGN